MIVDLRDYRTRPGCRDALISCCEETLFPEQRRLGATFLGLFREPDDPDRFVWLRGMADAESRARVLTAFYTEGDLWRARRAEVNRWIADSSDVLLVRPLAEHHPSRGPRAVVMVRHLEPTPLSGDAAAELRRRVTESVCAAGGAVVATFATDPMRNNYPRHPIRVGEHGLVWFASFPRRTAVHGLDPLDQRWLTPTDTSELR
ncbi:MAG: NIPSNAP family protein [Myxococcota bacterium]